MSGSSHTGIRSLRIPGRSSRKKLKTATSVHTRKSLRRGKKKNRKKKQKEKNAAFICTHLVRTRRKASMWVSSLPAWARECRTTLPLGTTTAPWPRSPFFVVVLSATGDKTRARTGGGQSGYARTYAQPQTAARVGNRGQTSTRLSEQRRFETACPSVGGHSNTSWPPQ